MKIDPSPSYMTMISFIIISSLMIMVAHAAPCAKVISPSTITATASTQQAGNEAPKAIDGNINTRWSGSGIGAYLTLDLGSTKSICSVSVAWYSGETRINTFTISTATVATATFTQVYSGSSLQNNDSQPITFSSSVQARYVRLTFKGNTVNTWSSVSEFKVYQAGFAHPGIFVSKEQLAYVKGRIGAGAAPYTGYYNKARSSSWGQITYTAKPVSVMVCGASNSNDVGCTDACNDGLAAYTQTLIWQYSGNVSYATNAIKILNAWSVKLTKIDMDSKNNSKSNGVLQAGWLGEMWVRTAEILRWGGSSGWTSTDINRFTTMLNTIILPLVTNGWIWGNGNWELTMAEATMNIGIFTENSTAYDAGLALARRRVPWYFYLASDGALPKAPPIYTTQAAIIDLWHDQGIFKEGLAQETCRDFTHTQFAMASTTNMAETARIQNLGLWAEFQARLVPAFEFHSYYLINKPSPSPSWLCDGKLALQNMPTWEVGYNQFYVRSGLPMRNTTALIQTYRQALTPTTTNLMMAWEGLTHASVGSV
eukprot:TRINITY_DN3822_c0_g2_i4.p1 TRINITY_DN3822_c0_g2~~TRINITY_DN3822_c0_g2_i4.p1  ORF type:complete len:539 (+),score=104.03 TRINITY_DN3822_c0_g2_i4:74-1690(+)